MVFVERPFLILFLACCTRLTRASCASFLKLKQKMLFWELEIKIAHGVQFILPDHVNYALFCKRLDEFIMGDNKTKDPHWSVAVGPNDATVLSVTDEDLEYLKEHEEAFDMKRFSDRHEFEGDLSGSFETAMNTILGKGHGLELQVLACGKSDYTEFIDVTLFLAHSASTVTDQFSNDEENEVNFGPDVRTKAIPVNQVPAGTYAAMQKVIKCLGLVTNGRPMWQYVTACHYDFCEV